MYLRECAPKSVKLTRWSLGLQDFDLRWQYRRGSDNQVADCLSRLGQKAVSTMSPPKRAYTRDVRAYWPACVARMPASVESPTT